MRSTCDPQAMNMMRMCWQRGRTSSSWWVSAQPAVVHQGLLAWLLACVFCCSFGFFKKQDCTVFTAQSWRPELKFARQSMRVWPAICDQWKIDSISPVFEGHFCTRRLHLGLRAVRRVVFHKSDEQIMYFQGCSCANIVVKIFWQHFPCVWGAF